MPGISPSSTENEIRPQTELIEALTEYKGALGKTPRPKSGLFSRLHSKSSMKSTGFQIMVIEGLLELARKGQLTPERLPEEARTGPLAALLEKHFNPVLAGSSSLKHD